MFLWDAKTGEQLAKLNNNGGNTITSVVLSPDGTFLAASSKGMVAAWDVADPKAVKYSGDRQRLHLPVHGGRGDG